MSKRPAAAARRTLPPASRRGGRLVVAALLVGLLAALPAGRGPRGAVAPPTGAEPPAAAAEAVRFAAWDVYLESEAPLAAWQVEVRYAAERTRVVGVEGGEPPFGEPPAFDEKGRTGGVIILAGYTLEDAAAPEGETRVARLHLRLAGERPATLSATAMTAATVGGEAIEVNVRVAPVPPETEEE
jgi:hypothetical protein